MKGLLCNMQEKDFSSVASISDRLCPVLFALPGGFLNVMPRCRPMTDEEFLNFDYSAFVTYGGHNGVQFELPVEEKTSSFGWLNSRVVAIDYGS